MIYFLMKNFKYYKPNINDAIEFVRSSPLKLTLFSLNFVIILYQIYQGFSTSSSIDMVGYRGEDDGAFFPIISKIHSYLAHFKIDILIKGHLIGEHFGYGWLFWMVSAIFTIPGAIISHLFGIDNFLISGVSHLSLALSFGGLFFFYKALNFYTKDELVKFAIIVLILCYPAFGYLSIKWHPTSFNFFFNCLLFYHLAKLEVVTKKQLKVIAIILAMSIGSRVTGIFMLPLVGLMLADRLKWQINKKNLKLAGYFFAILTFFSILFHDPSLLLFQKDYYLAHHKIISHWSNLLGYSFGCPSCANSSYRFTVGILNPFVKIYIFSFLALLFVTTTIVSLKNKETNTKKYDLFYIFITLGFVIFYLVFFVNYYISYSLTPYLFTVSFLFPIPLILLGNKNKILKISVIFILLVSNLFLNYKDLYVPYEEYQNFYDCLYKDRSKDCNSIINFNYVRYNHHATYHKSYIEGATKIREIVGPIEKYDDGLDLLLDFRIPTFYNARHRSNLVLISVFDNLDKAKDFSKKEYDYIGFFKHARILKGTDGVEEDIAYLIQNVKKAKLPQEEEKELIDKQQEMFSNWRKSRKIVDEFLKTKKLKHSYYKKVYEDDNFLFFKNTGINKKL